MYFGPYICLQYTLLTVRTFILDFYKCDFTLQRINKTDLWLSLTVIRTSTLKMIWGRLNIVFAF